MRSGSTSMLLASVLAISGLATYEGIRPAPRGTVTLFLSTDCPVAMQYTPRLNRLVAEFEPQGIAFRAVFPNDLESQDAVRRYMSERSYSFPFELDLGAVQSRKQGVTHVPYVIVRDARGKVTYRGAIDDHKDPNLVKRSYLQDALRAQIEGRKIEPAQTKPFGCVLMPGTPPPTLQSVNYAEHVAPILNRACVECHRPGEVAPFSLEGYEAAKKWAPMIALVTEQRQMPPWKAVPGFGEFHDENRLTEREIATLKRWSEAKAPQGDMKKAPPPPKFPADWSLGTPDAILQTKRPFKLAGEGKDEYRNFVLDLGNRETVWVKGMDVKPGNKQVVHHVIAYIDTSGRAVQLEQQTRDGQEGYDTFGGPGFVPFGALGGWAPGLRPWMTPEGTAFEVPAGAKIVVQIHYHRTGKDEADHSRVGLYFAKEKPRQPMRLAWLAQPMIRIPAGEKAYRAQLRYTVPANATIYAAMPHMHLLGRSMKATVRMPEGELKPLVWVDDWDFNWQMQYVLREPMRAPRGARIEVEAIFDNSSNNPNNPNDPPKEVRWGEETTDEMFLLVVPYTVDSEVLK